MCSLRIEKIDTNDRLPDAPAIVRMLRQRPWKQIEHSAEGPSGWSVKCRCGSESLHVELIASKDIVLDQVRIGAGTGRGQENTGRRLWDATRAETEVIHDPISKDSAASLGANDNPNLQEIVNWPLTSGT